MYFHFERIDLVIDLLNCNLRRSGFFTLHSVKIGHVLIDTFFYALHGTCHSSDREILITAIDGFKLAAINGNDRVGEPIKFIESHDKLEACSVNCFANVSPKPSNGFEVRFKRELTTSAPRCAALLFQGASDYPVAIRELALLLEGSPKTSESKPLLAIHLRKEASDERSLRWNKYQ